MTTVNIHEAETNLSRLIERVRAGEEIIIAKSGKPWVRLVPITEEKQPRRPGIARGAVTEAFFEPLPEEELQPWES